MLEPALLNHDLDLASLALVDVETTGLPPERHRVLSIAVVLLDSSGRIESEFHTLIDPGCDPGPVHVHGLTRQVLAGAPAFSEVLPRVAGMIRQRTVVAHNAAFDMAFLDAEFRRCGGEMPVVDRMCTLALARRVAPPTVDCRLGTLAVHYGVPQRRAHDALEDSRVLAGVLLRLLADASLLGVKPPVVPSAPATKPSGAAPFEPSRLGPKPPCAFRNPGRLETVLVQGMKVAITGETASSRLELTAAGDRAGLDMVGSVSRHTSLLVAHRHDGDSRKVRAAVAHGTPIVREADFLRLLANIVPGIPKSSPALREATPARTQERKPAAGPGPLAGRRILVLGGDHRTAGDIRSRVAERGGSVAVNLSRSVSDVIVLDNGDRDPRFAKIVVLGLPIHGPELVRGEATTTAPEMAAVPDTHAVGDFVVPRELSRGQVVDLPVGDRGAEWTFRVTWAETTGYAVDVVAFVLDDEELVSGDEDMVFFNQPITPGVRLQVNSASDHGVAVCLSELPDQARRVVIAAVVDGDDVHFGDVGAIEVEVSSGDDGATVMRGTLDAATTERSLRLVEVYLRNDVWRLRSVGQGYEWGLADLATSFGVDVD
ncbi:TerD family protein [Tsukamurella sp. USMM236]|uniref:TerD family protein n=1 Tax=Tsukamurella sp. USMM236 TaxID=3081301 RepID=UPI00301B17EC